MHDLRLAFRMLGRQPLTSTLAVVALALGIGLTTVMFSILNGAVLRGLPFAESDRLLHMAPFDVRDQDDFDTTPWEFAAWRARQTSFEDLAGFYVANANVVGPDGTPERYRAAWVTPNTFRVLGAQPVLGRDFDDAAGVTGAQPVVVLSDRVWRDRFAARPDALGQTLRVNGVSMTVIGVMPPRFAFPTTQELWVALAVNPARTARNAVQGLEVIGRLRDGVSPDQAGAEMATIEAALLQDVPDERDAITVEVKGYVEEFLGGETVQMLTMMFVAVLLVLVIACVNVANLVLARAADRTREVAVRAALGAGRLQVVTQTLTEVLVLAAAGAALGLSLAWAGLDVFNRQIVDTNPPFWLDIRIDTTVLAFVTAVTVLAALVSGLVPALRAASGDVAPLLNDEGRGTTSLRIGRLSRGLVVGEMALSFALLVVSALTIQSIRNVSRFDPGVAVDQVFAARVSLPASDYPDPDRQRRFTDALTTALSVLPGVRSAALATSLPPNLLEGPVALPGVTYATGRDYPQAQVTTVSDDFFDVLRMPARQGRLFTQADSADALPVAIVSENFARAYYPDGALGRQVRVVDGDAVVWRTIVGLVQDMRELDFGASVTAAVYVPLAQAPTRALTVLAHTEGDPLAQTAAVRRAGGPHDRNLPIYNVTTLQETMDRNAWAWRVFGTLFTTFGLAALFMATVGLYGVMAFSVSRRTPEIGVRIAMGAEPRDVMGMVLRQGAVQVALGVGLGAGLAVLLSRAMQLMFFQVGADDPRYFLVVAVLLLLTGLAAAIVPARRAARVDPMVALRG